MYGCEKVIWVKILSIMLLGVELNGSFRGVLVCIQCSLLDKWIGVFSYFDNQLVMMCFEYNQNLVLFEQDCIFNLLVFQVIEYCVDNDYLCGVLVLDDGVMQVQVQQVVQVVQQVQGVYDFNNFVVVMMIDLVIG